MIKIQHETLRGDLENIFEMNLKVLMHIVYWIHAVHKSLQI